MPPGSPGEEELGAADSAETSSLVAPTQSTYANRPLRDASDSRSESNAEFADLQTEDLQFVVEAGAFWDGLDELEEIVDQAGEMQHLASGAVLGVSSGLTAGYVLWLMRGGYLLSCLLAQMPAWRFIDPLPVLDYLDKDEEYTDDASEQDSLEGMLSENAEESSRLEDDTTADAESDSQASAST